MSGYYEFFTEEDDACNISLEDVGYKECDKSTQSYQDLRQRYIMEIRTKDSSKIFLEKRS